MGGKASPKIWREPSIYTDGGREIWARFIRICNSVRPAAGPIYGLWRRLFDDYIYSDRPLSYPDRQISRSSRLLRRRFETQNTYHLAPPKLSTSRQIKLDQDSVYPDHGKTKRQVYGHGSGQGRPARLHIRTSEQPFWPKVRPKIRIFGRPGGLRPPRFIRIGG